MKNKNYLIICFILIFLLILINQQFFITSSKPINYFFYYLINILFLSLIFIVVHFYVKFKFKKKSKICAELKAKNKELTISNERHEIVAKATSDTTWDWDLKTGGFIWNKGIEEVFGYKKEDIGPTFQWWFGKIHPEDSLKISVEVYSYIGKKIEKWQDTYRFLCADGTYKHVYDRGFLVMNNDNEVVRVIGSMQDISKLKEEEERLKLLETVITHTKDSVIIFEFNEAEVDAKTIFVNDSFKKLTGFESNEVIGKSTQVFLNKKTLSNNLKKLIDSLKKKEPYSFEILNYKKDKTEYWSHFDITPLSNLEKTNPYWVTIQRDITKEKERMIEREQLIKELTQNNKDLKQFSYIISHNLRAPLSNLIGLLNLVEDIDIEDNELKELIEGFDKSTHFLNETINNLNKIITIRDHQSIEKETVVISEVFQNTLEQLNNIILISNPKINSDFSKINLLTINKPYLESIFLNLITNAIKYRKEDKQLEINISTEKEKNKIIINLSDNGIGIDLDRHKDKIFGLYQKFHNYPDSKGLGLYLVKSQVESMDGTIEIESKVGEGTSFKIRFKQI